MNGKAKEIADYYECLKEANNKYMFKYILVLEDDAEPATPTSIQDVVHVIPNLIQDKRDIILAKLFYSFGYQGFSMNFETIIEVASFYLLTLCIVYAFLFLVDKKISLEHFRINILGFCFSSKLWCTIVISCIIILMVSVIGRQSTLLALKNYIVPYRTSTAHSDQTTAILYPRIKLGQLMYLMQNKFSCVDQKYPKQEIAIDIQLANMIEKYQGANKMIWVHGNFFNHIGYYTSLHFKALHVKITEFAQRYVFLPDQLCNDAS